MGIFYQKFLDQVFRQWVYLPAILIVSLIDLCKQFLLSRRPKRTLSVQHDKKQNSHRPPISQLGVVGGFADHLGSHVGRRATIGVDVFVALPHYVNSCLPTKLKPKSMIFRLRCLLSKIFSDLMSLWVMFISCRYLTASRTCLKISLAYFYGRYPYVLLFMY